MGLLGAARREQWRNPFLPSEEGFGAFLSGAGDSASFGFGDELMGLGAGLNAAMNGGAFGDAYDYQAELSRERLRDARRDHPLATAGGSIAGSLAGGGLLGLAARSARGSALAAELARFAPNQRRLALMSLGRGLPGNSGVPARDVAE